MRVLCPKLQLTRDKEKIESSRLTPVPKVRVDCNVQTPALCMHGLSGQASALHETISKPVNEEAIFFAQSRSIFLMNVNENKCQLGADLEHFFSA